MSTRKSSFAIVSVRIKRFPLFIIMPLRCLSEVVEGAMDILCLFKRIGKKAYNAVYAIESALMLVKDFGSLDIINVDITSPDARVKIKILLR